MHVNLFKTITKSYLYLPFWTVSNRNWPSYVGELFRFTLNWSVHSYVTCGQCQTSQPTMRYLLIITIEFNCLLQYLLRKIYWSSFIDSTELTILMFKNISLQSTIIMVTNINKNTRNKKPQFWLETNIEAFKFFVQK